MPQEVNLFNYQKDREYTQAEKDFIDYMKTDIGYKAWKYDQENPHVFTLFERFAREALNKGFKNFGAAAIIERMRWHTAMESTDEQFKISANHTAFYARKLMAQYPEFAGFFRTQAV